MDNITYDIVNAWHTYLHINYTNHTSLFSPMPLERFYNKIYSAYLKYKETHSEDFETWYKQKLKLEGKINPEYQFTFTLQKLKTVSVCAPTPNEAYQYALQEAKEEGLTIVDYAQKELIDPTWLSGNKKTTD